MRLRFIILLFIPLCLHGQNEISYFSSFSYDYVETIHEETFTYPSGVEADVLSFDFDIGMIEIDTLNQYAEFDIVIGEVFENNRFGFKFLELIVGKAIRIKYNHNQKVEWIKYKSILDFKSTEYKEQLIQLAKLKENLEHLLLAEFGLFDGIFLSKDFLDNRIAIFCNREYDYKYVIEREVIYKKENKLTFRKTYSQKTIQNNFKKNLDERILETIELNRKLQGDDYDVIGLEVYERMQRDKMAHIMKNLFLAEDKMVQYFDDVGEFPQYSEARFYNIQNICKGKILSMIYDVYIEKKK